MSAKKSLTCHFVMLLELFTKRILAQAKLKDVKPHAQQLKDARAPAKKVFHVYTMHSLCTHTHVDARTHTHTG